MQEQGESQFDLHMTRMYGLLSDSLWIYNLEIIIDVKKTDVLSCAVSGDNAISFNNS